MRLNKTGVLCTFAGLIALIVSSVCAQDKVEDTKFSVGRGFFTKTFTLEISCATPGATIYYTLDGSDPRTSIAKLVLQGSSPVSITIDPASTYGGKRPRPTPAVIVRAYATYQKLTPTNTDTHTYIFPSSVVTQGDILPNDGKGFVYWSTEMDPRVTKNSAYSGKMVDALTSLPTISLSMHWDHIFGAPGIYRGNNLADKNTGGTDSGSPNDPDWVIEVPCSMELFYPDKPQFSSFKGTHAMAGLRIQGAGARRYDGTVDHKQSLSLVFRSEYGDGSLKYDFFESAPLHSDSVTKEFERIILRAGHNKCWGAEWDPTHTAYTRDQMGRDMQIEASGFGSHGTFAHLYLNGIYFGIYNPCERPDHHFMASYFGGSSDDYYSGKERNPSISGSSSRYDTMKKSISTSSNLASVEPYVDVDALIDMGLINTYASTGDFPQYYFGNRNNPPGPVRYVNWDMEETFGGGSTRTNDKPNPDRLKYIDPFINLFTNNIDFRVRWYDRAYEHFDNNGTFMDEKVIAMWKTLNNFIDPAIIAESARWGDEIRTTNPITRDVEWVNNVNAVIKGMQGKQALMLSQLRSTSLVGNAPLYPSINPPSFSINGGSSLDKKKEYSTSSSFTLQIKDISGKAVVYYTLDGQDPRASGGAVSSAASGGQSTVTSSIGSSVTVKARAYVSSNKEWSALHYINIKYKGQPAPVQIQITEINYNPYEPTSSEVLQGFKNADDFEFLELYNPGSSSISLAGYTFADGLTFTFEAGAPSLGAQSYGVLVSNAAAFKARYGSSAKVLGAYGDSSALSNGGELVTLATPSLDVSSQVEYGDASPWPETADGGGYSLVLKSGATDLSQASSWSASKCTGGSPGGPEPSSCPTTTASPVTGTVIITEIMYNPPYTDTASEAGITNSDVFEFVEFHNPTKSTISLTGYKFKDGITFTFGSASLGAGAYGVVVANTTAFKARYGNAVNILGDYGSSGTSLSNGGELVTVQDQGGNTLLKVTYDDASPWAEEADGVGYSLVLVDVSTGSDSDATHWRKSTCLLGSPSRADETSGSQCTFKGTILTEAAGGTTKATSAASSTSTSTASTTTSTTSTTKATTSTTSTTKTTASTTVSTKKTRKTKAVATTAPANTSSTSTSTSTSTPKTRKNGKTRKA